jgi:TatD DNase family protein
LRDHLNDREVLAVGEVGLDFYYEHSPRDIQTKVFRNQLELAQEFNLPIEIHTRDAEKETIEMVKAFGGKIRGLVHCFSGSQWLADEALALGLNLSISGIVTFPKAEELRQVVKSIPLERIHVETDAPFLTPVPFRGKKNTPALVVHTAQKVAELHGISLEQLAQQVRENALQLFPKLHWH